MSLGEITVLLIVGIVVVGPKNLPSMMRTAGQWVTKLRRMSTDLRSQSGIDDLIRFEGLEKEIAELRSLSRMNMVDSLISPAFGAIPAAGARDRAPYNHGNVAPEVSRALEFHPVAPLREREYPLAGCDAHGAMSDDAGPYLPHDPELVATEAPHTMLLDDEGHPIEVASPSPILFDAEGHPIDAEGHPIEAVSPSPILFDAEGHPIAAAPAEPAASVTVAPSTPAEESAAS